MLAQIISVVFGSLKRECLDQGLIQGNRRLSWVVQEDVTYYHQDWPHPGMMQKTPGYFNDPILHQPVRLYRNPSLETCIRLIPEWVFDSRRGFRLG